MRATASEAHTAAGVRRGGWVPKRIYLKLTDGNMLTRLWAGMLTTPACQGPRLDAGFVGLYLQHSALAAALDRAWAPSIDGRDLARERIQIQFALAGTNAHTNQDPPNALVPT